MMEILIILALVALGTVYFEVRKPKNVEGTVLYLYPLPALRRFIVRASALLDWRLFGEIATAVVLGPLSFRLVRRRALLAYILLAPFVSRGVPALLAYLSMGLSGLALFYIAASAGTVLLGYISGIHPSPGVGLALPGLSVGPLRIPFVEGVIALALALLVHEGAHGVVALRHRIPLRRAGLILLGFLPIGAFVDPNDRIFERSNDRVRAAVLSAGPVANVLVALLFTFFLLALSPLSAAIQNYECSYGEGARILSVPEYISVEGLQIPSPARSILKPGDVILYVDENRIRCASQLLEVLAPFRERGEDRTVRLVVRRGGETFVASITLSRGYLGIQGVETDLSSPPAWYTLAVFLLSVLGWIVFLNYMIGVVNALPLPPLDGGGIFRILFSRALRPLAALTAALLILSALPWFV